MNKLVTLSFLFSLWGAACYAQTEKRVILKLDDMLTETNGRVSPAWQRVSDYLEGKGIKASFGIIGFSLEEDNPEYFKWITDRADRGLIEFWNHGFWRRSLNDSIGEFERSFEEQLYALRMTDSLARVKLGLELQTWGPHWSGTNADTDLALSKMPQIRIALGYPKDPVHFKGIMIPPQIRLEFPTHNPDFEVFKKSYLEKKDDLSLFYLQGHPRSWNEERWQNFVRIIEFLESEGISFIKPSDILKNEAGIFREDFNGEKIDESIWTIGTWKEHGGQMGKERCFVKDGALNLQLVNDNGTYLSSAIQTNRKFLYGRWEARLKPSAVPGVLNSFFTIDWGEGGNATRQEIDIEFLTFAFGENKGKVHFAVHARGLKSFETNPDVELDFNPSDDFHVWGFDITPEHIEWFVDDKTLLVYQYAEHAIKVDAPYMLKLNHWTSAKWVKGPPEPGVMSTYLIDWIQFTPYKK